MRYVYRTCPCGEIKGIGTDSYSLFKGVRYARAERWEPPEEVISWNGVYDATFPGTWCPQQDSFITEKNGTAQFYADETVEKLAIVYGEDCLNLNIWAPPEAENAPVLVYIHGGSYETGSGAAPSTNGYAYCQKGIVTVTINYRLNLFASAVGDGYSGNYGLQDQVCALRWIKHNIAAFGGDPNRVTIMGESAGAMSVQNLIFTPLAKGLFCGAIMLSGAGILPDAFHIRGPQTTKELWENIKASFGVETVAELKQVPVGELFCTWKDLYESNPKYGRPATPVIDGVIIPDSPRALAEKGAVNAVPTIVSLLSEDMWPHTLYHAALEWGLLMSCAGLPPVYGMFFDRTIPGTDIGAYHGGDVRYAFGTFESSWRPYDEIDERISANMIEYFSTFAKTGAPNEDGLAIWTPITQEHRRFMHFGDEPCAMCTVPEEHLELVQARNKPFPGM